MRDKYILTAESVTEGHPDKLCDTIADSVLDACLEHDPDARVACEVMATAGKIIVAGEITAMELPDIPAIVCRTVRETGYVSDYEVEVITHDQSGDIAGAVNGNEQLGAGDQGMEAMNAGQTGISVEKPSAGPQKAEPITVGEWMDRWLEKYAKPTVKLSTYCSYEQLIRGHVKPQIGGYYMNTLTGEDLQDFFNERRAQGNLKGNGGLSSKTLTNLRNMMHLAFGQAVKNKLLPENLVEGIRLPKAEKHEMRVLGREEQTRLILAARRAPEPAAFGIIFDLFTGLRIGELCGLRWENVDMEGRSFKVCETRNRLPNFDDSIETSTSVATVKTTKTDNSRRTVYIMDGLYQDFLDYQTIQMSLQKQNPGYNPDGYVFCQENGQPYEPRTYQDLFKRCVRQAGIADANFHSLRHTFATRALEQGMDVVTLSRLLGHATPSITLDKYGHALNDHKRASVEKLGGVYSAGRGIPRSRER